MIYKIALAVLLLVHLQVHAQEEVTFENDLHLSGNLILGQDLTKDSIAGMMRWDTVSMTFQGFNGSEWISFISPSPSTGTDTLEVGDRYGGGIVFYTSGSHGLIVTDFDLGIPTNIINTDIPWGPSSTATNAVSETNGLSNTALIIASIDPYNDGGYAAKICDDLVHGGYDDWYLPSVIEFQTMSQAIGFFADAPLTDLANLTDDAYWTSTEFIQNQAKAYVPNGNTIQNGGKQSVNYVRAIRAY